MSSVLNTISATFRSVARPASVLAVLAATGLCTLAPSVVNAAPEPAPVATQWEFTFDNGPLRLAWVEDAQGISKPYFYLTYRVTNHWGGVKLFAPDVQLSTDGANVISSGQQVPSEVTEEIMERLDNPLLESPTGIVSNVLQGVEHARDGIVIWPAETLNADEVTIYFAGLSGESETYIVGRDSDNPRRYNLRKCLMLRYSTPGEFGQQGDRPFDLDEKRWIMR